MLKQKCPRADELAKLANDGKASRRLTSHINQCPTCTEIVANLRRDTELVKELQSALRSPPDDSIRETLMDACRSAKGFPSSG